MDVAEDINITGDASQAISEMRKLESAVISSMKAAGASTKELNATSKNLERTFSNVASVAVKSSQKSAAALGKEQAQTKSLLTATEALAEARRRAFAGSGTKENARGQLIDANSGKFATSSQKAKFEEIAANERLILSENALNGLRQRHGDAERARAAQAAAAARTETDAYKERQRSLERAFSGKVVGLAAPDATGFQKFANTLSQIPPATWNQKIGNATDALLNMSNSTRYALYEVANSAAVAGTAFIAFGALSIRAAVAHERAFANVQRTTQTSAEGYAVLRRQLEEMSMELPITYEELTNIAMAAGQLGIGAGGVAQFTKVVAQLTATTNLTSDAAGIALARFRTFFAEAENPALAVSESTFTNLASSILKVGVNSIASESGIVNVAVQIASMGDYAGLTANQVIGLAGALSSIGVAPELSRGTITRTFSLIGNAVSEGGLQLEKFANLSGVSAKTFSEAWGTDDFAGIFNRMLMGIRDYGGDANLMLMQLGFNSVRDRPLLLRLAGAADEAGNSGMLLSQTLRDAYAGWVQNSELAMQYGIISRTTSARLQVLGQSFEQLAASMGEQTGGFLGEMAVQLTGVIRGFEEFSNSDFGQTLGTMAVQGSLFVGALLLIIGGAARSAASIQAVGTAFREMADKGSTATGTLSLAFRGLNAALGVIGVVGAIAGIVGGMIAMDDAARKAKLGVQDIGGLVSAMGEDAKAGATGLTFYAESNKQAALEQKNTRDISVGMTAALYDVRASAVAGASGMDDLAASTSKAKYVFGDAAKEFYRSQLLQSESFQGLFDPSKALNGLGSSFQDLGIDAVGIDWDKLMRDSLTNGGINKKALMSQLLEETGIKQFDIATGELSQGYVGVKKYVDSVADTFGNLSPEIQKVVNAQAAFQGQSRETFEEIVDGSGEAASAIGQLDEATQKAIDGIAQGFTKFVDTGSLIGLTQKMNEIFSQGDDVSSSDKAAQWEEAWSDAYGGAAFSLQSYLDVFGRAAGEQGKFVEGLQVLRERMSTLGLSDAVINDLAQMGPEGAALVQALVSGTDAQLVEFENLWGQTGYDSMVMFATQAAIGQEIVNNVLRYGMGKGGLEALQAFNAALSSGIGVDAALASLQLDLNGKPLKPVVNKPAPPPNLTEWEKQVWANNNRLNTTATVRVTAINGGAAVKIGGKLVTPDGYAEGGYTGAGSKYQPAGVVHAEEFVMNAEATRKIGVGNLYAMMRSASSGRAAPRGKGYAQGGLVSSGNGVGGYMMLHPQTIQQLAMVMDKVISVDGRLIARTATRGYTEDSRTGAY